MQLKIQLTTEEQMNNAWVFARGNTPHRSLIRRSLMNINQSVITACSKEAKNLGINAGMLVEDAKLLLPDLKVLVYGAGHARK